MMTYAEYRELERRSEFRHEFIDGEMIEMPGASRPHNIVTATLIRLIGNAVVDKPFEVYASQMRVRTADDTGAYPDISVASDAPVLGDDYGDELLSPILIVEVLSDSTESFDRGAKFEHYQTLASLEEYVLVDPRRAHVDVFRREHDGWKLRSYGAGATLELASVGATLAMDEL
jgi:Uma2 family endonuclease